MVAGGGTVGVGYGIINFCPTEIGQLEGKLLAIMMLWTETLKLNAICEQEPSAAETVYSKGGCRVGVGVSVAGKVGVAGMVAVGVSVGVEVSTLEKVSGSLGTRKKVRPAATAITARSEPMAAGRLSVSCGMLAA